MPLTVRFNACSLNSDCGKLFDPDVSSEMAYAIEYFPGFSGIRALTMFDTIAENMPYASPTPAINGNR